MKLFAKESKMDKMYLGGILNGKDDFTLDIVTPAGTITFESEEEVQELLALIGEQLFYIYKNFLSQLRKENNDEKHK